MARGEPDDGSRYYDAWLRALERLVTAKGLTDAAALAERKDAWADAYRHTPHGKPVLLPDSSRSRSVRVPSVDFGILPVYHWYPQ